jgi:hypothetical protein
MTRRGIAEKGAFKLRTVGIGGATKKLSDRKAAGTEVCMESIKKSEWFCMAAVQRT